MIARLITAAAATALLAGAAHAQSSGPVSPSQAAAQNATGSWTGPLGQSSPAPMTSSSSSAGASMQMDSSMSSAPSASTMGADASVTASAAATPMAGSTVTVSTVTNGPVPDTAENRAKYGQPMSRAGKMTRPAGN